uniref:Uncharacterized protein n=1 Tax=Arundo donax TaxID=35708 RepID=A0A0A9GK85_ARUDO
MAFYMQLLAITTKFHEKVGSILEPCRAWKLEHGKKSAGGQVN